jgi:hypothetical protein
MSKTIGWVMALLAIVGIGVGVYMWRQKAKDAAWEPPPPVVEATPSAPPAGGLPPPIQFPIEKAGLPDSAPDAKGAKGDKAPAELPPLAQSDGTVVDGLSRLFDKGLLERYFNTDQIVRRFVVTVDNLARKEIPSRLAAAKPIAERFSTARGGEAITLGEANYARYTPFVNLVTAIDTKRLVGTYVRFYPLFQKQYEELGYPDGYFNDRLVEAIDSMLAAPQVSGPVRLVQPKVLYQFEDPDLEALPAGQKAILRMGPENAAKVKSKLREIRAELTGNAPPRS